MKWRWDQGRLDYFQIDEIKKISQALIAFDGHALPRASDPDSLRTTLEAYSDRPFLPDHYKVWRNYKRVFGCQMLASEVAGILISTDLCKQMAKGDLTGDDYLIHVARHFYYPSPVFDGYVASGEQAFPMCAIFKLLVSDFINKAKPVLSLDEIVGRIKGNNMNGVEGLPAYSSLKDTGLRIPNGDDEIRQIREMIGFMSQLSFLKWSSPYLYLDLAGQETALSIAQIFDPAINPRKADPSQELLQLGSVATENAVPEAVASEGLHPYDEEFVEGVRVRKTHLRMERSSKLRELYFEYAEDPHHCDMCSEDTLIRYPWVDKLIELHHLLPLSSSIKVESKSTSLKDIVGLCPSCHRATHKFYTKWLKSNSQKDFNTPSEAHKVYKLAKTEIVI